MGEEATKEKASGDVLGMPKSEWVKFFIVTVGGGILVGAVLASLGWWLASSKPHLTVRVRDTARFQGDKFNTGFATVSVTNDGSKEAEAVECQFALNGVQEAKVTPAHLNAVTTVKDGRVTVTVPMLNEQETLEIAAYTNNASGVEDRVTASVRGKGVVGEPYQPPQYDWKSIVATLVSSLVITLVSSWAGERKGYKDGKRDGRQEVQVPLSKWITEQNTHMSAMEDAAEALRRAAKLNRKNKPRNPSPGKDQGPDSGQP
jgi:hypothetical protein